MKKHIIFLILFFTIIFTNAQDQNSLPSIKDSIKANLYTNPDKSIRFLHQYIKINKKINNIDNIILANSTLAVAYEVKHEIDSALFYHHENLKMAKKPGEIIRIKYNIASLLEARNQNKNALELYYEILNLANKNDEREIIEAVKTSIISLENKILNSQKSLNALEEDFERKKEGNDPNLRFTRKALIEAYVVENKLKKALVLIEAGKSEAVRSNDCEFIYYMNILGSKIHILQNNLEIAEQEARKALPCAIQLNNQKFISNIDLRIAQIHYLRQNYFPALDHLRNIEFKNIQESTELLTKYYRLLADTYKNLDSNVQSTNYYLKYWEEREKLSQNKLSTLEILHELNLDNQVSSLTNKYESKINDEKFQKENYRKKIWYGSILSIFLILFFIALIFYFRKKSKINQERFDILILKIKDYEDKMTEAEANVIEDSEEDIESTPEDKPVNNQDDGNAVYVIDDKKVEEILIKLEKLEDKLYFLRQDCTLHNMAKKLKTNTSYLSKIINTHLGKSFSIYINELRINYAILEIKNNKRLRSYSVQGIAEEMGYKNADAFARYFKAATGISPSVYIKKIKETNKGSNA